MLAYCAQILVAAITFTSSSAGHAQIGNYSQLLSHCTPDRNTCPLVCGYGRESEMMDDSCFKWHQSGQDQTNIMNGRPTVLGEVPFVVFIGTFDNVTDKFIRVCSGSILNERMVVTAGHCIDGVSDYWIAIGERNYSVIVQMAQALQADYPNLYSVEKSVTYPGFVGDTLEEVIATKEYDIGLMFTGKPMRLSPYLAQPICLPPPNIANQEREYAMISGWGDTGYWYEDPDNVDYLKAPEPEFLPIGWTQILPEANNDTDKYGKLILGKYVPYPDGTVGCAGDSGGPLIQYVNGRAVLIGTTHGDIVYNSTVINCALDDTSISAWVRVSRKVDWIVQEWNNWLTGKNSNNAANDPTAEGAEIPYDRVMKRKRGPRKGRKLG